MTEPSREPIDDAERIRFKRLAKLSQSPSAPSTSSTPTPPPQSSQPKLPPKVVEKRVIEQPAQEPARPKKKVPTSNAPQRLDFDIWQNTVLTKVLKVTLDKQKAEESGHDLVWLKSLQLELQEEGYKLPIPLTFDIMDRLLIARLSIDPGSGSDEDIEYLAVLASLPPQQTVLQFLTGCWRRLNNVRNELTTKNRYVQQDMNSALPKLEDLRMLLMSYIGLTMQDPEMFPQPTGKTCGSEELLESLFNLSSLSVFSGGYASSLLLPGELRDFFSDLANRWAEDNLEDIISPLIRLLCFHPSLKRPEGIAGSENIWRWIMTSLELLVSVKPIAMAITRLDSWCPSNVTGAMFEHASLMGPLLRLGVFNRQWSQIASTYFSDPLQRTRQDVDSSNATLRVTLQGLQTSLFQIFNTMVRASSESREAVLAYFATAANLNVKRGGLQVDFDTVASDTFMINIHAILLRFAEPFMDSSYSKMDRIDTEYYRHSSRLNAKDETRLKATSEEVAKWVEEGTSSTPSPNFITETFYLAMTFNHYGLVRTIQVYDEIRKQLDNMQRHLDTINADTTWVNTPLQARVDSQIAAVKEEMAKLHQTLFAYQVQLADPDYTQRNITFTTFLTIWLIRFVDPHKTHPMPYIKLPLPQNIPDGFRMLPEFFVEDVVDYYLFLVTHQPHTLQLSGKIELVDFALTFLSSTWYITNPYLKSKLVQILFFGTLPYGHETFGLLGGVLNSHPLALEHLISCLVSFYIEVESTGTHTQFYDKFETRRQIAHIWKLIWTNHVHREALRNQANDLDKFVRFVNLMMNDVTFLLDEALSKLTEIYGIQVEMEDAEAWAAKPLEQRRERERTLHQLEGSATTYTSLGKSTVSLLKEFTAETKQPFMTPEIVDRLAAMLTYNLDALVGPRCQDLKVKNPEKYRFNPRQLLSDILQVFLNLSDQEPFIKAVAGEGRSYKKELFERAAGIAKRRALKVDEEIEQLRMFVVKVEATKATLEDEEVEDVPDEFLDPLMFTIMRDPVTLPSSKVVVDRSTIKAHLLSDTNDPFNRVPLKIEDVVSNPEMKAKIEAFIIDRRSKKKTEVTINIPSEEAMEVDHPTL